MGVFPFTAAVVISMITAAWVRGPNPPVAAMSEAAAQPMAIAGLPAHQAPGFSLTDQRGVVVGLSEFRGKAVLLAFIDDRCTQVCPLLAQEFVIVDRDLGAERGSGSP